jgi:hypothetical protein
MNVVKKMRKIHFRCLLVFLPPNPSHPTIRFAVFLFFLGFFFFTGSGSGSDLGSEIVVDESGCETGL